jgi:5-methylcytosine-specific restriction enzyme A
MTGLFIGVMWRMARLKAAPVLLGTMPRKVSPPVKLAEPFYQSREWRDFAALIKRQRGYLCEGCGKDCKPYPFTLKADHIIERRDGGADFDPLNVQCLCQGCHNAKTARARGERWG